MDKEYIQAEFCRSEDLPDEIRQKLVSDPGKALIHERRIYVLLDQNVICVPDDHAGYELACGITQKRNGTFSAPGNTAEMYEKIFIDPYYQPDPALLKKLGIPQVKKRCAAVFRSFSPIDKDLCSILSGMAPVEAGDALFPIDYQTAAFIKNAERQSPDEVTEFVEAVIGTLETEGITDVRAGIGREFTDVSGLREGCAQALEALRLGMKYHRKHHVYTADRQTLDQIVDSIPDEQKRIILESFFRHGSAAALSEETLETVRVFFQNDLNLTAASKQLFIHRNTLNYRLDKIRKEFGLDLRSFQDAVVFRIVSEIANQS